MCGVPVPLFCDETLAEQCPTLALLAREGTPLRAEVEDYGLQIGRIDVTAGMRLSDDSPRGDAGCACLAW